MSCESCKEKEKTLERVREVLTEVYEILRLKTESGAVSASKLCIKQLLKRLAQ